MIFSDARAQIKQLSPLQLRGLLEGVLGYRELPAEDAVLPAGEVVVLWLADLLEQLNLLSQDQRTLLLKECLPELQQFGGELDQCLEVQDTREPRQLPALLIGFADRRYATCTGWKRFLDLHTGSLIPQLPTPALETISYSVTTLYMERWKRVLEHPHGEEARHAASRS